MTRIRIIADYPKMGQDSVARLAGKEFQAVIDRETWEASVRTQDYDGSETEIVLNRGEYEFVKKKGKK